MKKSKRGGHNKIDVDPEWLIDLYVHKRVGGEEIARQTGVSRHSIYRTLKELGITRNNSEAHIGLQVGYKNGNYKGGCRDSLGYWLIYLNGVQIREHRVLAEKKIGRPLRPEEVVHHINGDNTDNRMENLQVLASSAEHGRIHLSSEEAKRRGKLAWKRKKALRAKNVPEDQIQEALQEDQQESNA